MDKDSFGLNVRKLQGVRFDIISTRNRRRT